MYPYLILALVAGAALPIQIGINAALSKEMASPIGAATISFALGTISLAAYFLITRQTMPSMATMQALPWWVLTGGTIGAFYVGATVIAAPYIGAALLVALVIAGQIGISLVLDHFGFAGFPEQPVTLWRAIGALMIFAGVVIIKQN
jgi:bacterial/archaeal transporter family-2 protein